MGFYFLFRALSRILAGLVQTDERDASRVTASLFLPVALLNLYPLKLWFSIPQYGHLLFAVVGLLLVVNLFRFRGRLSGVVRPNAVARGVAGRFLPVAPFVVLAGAIVFAIKKFVLGGTIAERGRRIAEVRYFSPHWGDLLRRLNYQGETMLYLGAVALILMALGGGLLAWHKAKGRMEGETDGQAGFWFGMFLLFTFLSLGLSVSRVPLYAFFYKVVPYFKYPRVPGRMIFISYAAMAFCVAWVLDRFPVKGRGVKWGVAGLVAIGLCVDYFPPRPIGLCLLDRGKAVYAAMEKEGMPPKTVLELPIWPGDSAWSTIYQYYVTRFRYPMVNGYSPVVAKDYVDDVFYGLYPMDVGEASGRARETLTRLNVKYVAFHADAYPYKISPFPSWMTLRRLKALPYLKEVAASDFMALFRLRENKLSEGFDPKAVEAIDSPVGVLWEAERSRHLIGRVIRDPDASAGKALATFKSGERGMMMGNQHRFFPCGWYEGVIRLKIAGQGSDPGTKPLGALLITGRHRRETFLEKEIKLEELKEGTYSDIRFSFHVPSAQKIECIVYSNGTAPLCLDYAFIAFRGRGEGPAVFQAEDLFHQAPVRPMPDGNGTGVRFSPDVLNNRGIGGPLHRLMPGRYTATFYLAAEGKGKTAAPVAILRVARGHQLETLAERTVTRGELDPAGKTIAFHLNFRLTRPSILQFPVYYQGNGILWVDRIEVAKSRTP